MNWKLLIIEKDGFNLRIYQNPTNTKAIVFSSFGRVRVYSGSNAVNLAIEIIFHKYSSSTVTSLEGYKLSKEDTQILAA